MVMIRKTKEQQIEGYWEEKNRGEGFDLFFSYFLNIPDLKVHCSIYIYILIESKKTEMPKQQTNITKV